VTPCSSPAPIPHRSLPADPNQPGQLFICRVIGNIILALSDAIGGVSATIEYAVGVMGVPDVIVCGHTDCGVMERRT
jgi:carbonic anhydrase